MCQVVNHPEMTLTLEKCLIQGWNECLLELRDFFLNYAIFSQCRMISLSYHMSFYTSNKAVHMDGNFQCWKKSVVWKNNIIWKRKGVFLKLFDWSDGTAMKVTCNNVCGFSFRTPPPPDMSISRTISPPPVRFSCMSCAGVVWILSGITHWSLFYHETISPFYRFSFYKLQFFISQSSDFANYRSVFQFILSGGGSCEGSPRPLAIFFCFIFNETFCLNLKSSCSKMSLTKNASKIVICDW